MSLDPLIAPHVKAQCDPVKLFSGSAPALEQNNQTCGPYRDMGGRFGNTFLVHAISEGGVSLYEKMGWAF